MGRPTKYKPELNELVTKFCMLGATNEQIADFLDVGLRTVELWIQKDREFMRAVKRGRLGADADIVQSLYQRAKGYSHPEQKHFQHEGNIITVDTVKHYPPDTAAAFIWLKNRRPKDWKNQPEVIQHEHTIKTLEVVKASDYQKLQISKKSA